MTASTCTSPFEVLDTRAMLTAPPPPIRWVVRGMVARGSLAILSGREKTVKSLVAQALAAQVARGGGDIAGVEASGGRAMYIDAENGRDRTWRRLRGLGLEIDHADAYVPVIVSKFDMRGQGVDLLGALLNEHRPDFVVFDSYRSLWGGNENDSGEVAAVLDPLRSLLRDRGVAGLLLVHAARHGSYRGSTALGASVEAEVSIRSEQGDPDPKRRRLRGEFSRDGGEMADAWCRIDGDEQTGVVLIEPADPWAGEGDDGLAATSKPVVAGLVQTVREMLAIGPVPTTADVARKLGREPKDQSVRRCLQALKEAGEIEKTDRGWASRDEVRPKNAREGVSARGYTVVDTLTPPAGSGVDARGYGGSEGVTQGVNGHGQLTPVGAVPLGLGTLFPTDEPPVADPAPYGPFDDWDGDR